MSRSINNFYCNPIGGCGSGGSSSTAPKTNYTAVVDPTVTDDNTAGYSIGSEWINLLTNKVFVLTNSTTGAAIWVETSGGGGGGSPSGANGSIQFAFGGLFASDNANLFWNNTTKRMGIKTNAPATELHVVGDSTITGIQHMGVGQNKFRTFLDGSDNYTMQSFDSVESIWVNRMIINKN